MGSNYRTVIVGNGILKEDFLKILRESDFVIGVDRAAYWLIQQGRTPDVAIGDFDSVTPDELSIIEQSVKTILRFPPEKNETDMELALKYADGLHPKEVLIFGATGNRLDHTLTNLFLIQNHVLIDEYNRIRFVGRGKTVIERSSYRYISILPYTKSITLSLSGFRYDLEKITLVRGTSRGVSNEIVGKQGEITLFSGKAWIIESND